ncbi:MAG: hypothetical protein ACR2GQ_01570 [Gemmatimonadota bacterium]
MRLVPGEFKLSREVALVGRVDLGALRRRLLDGDARRGELGKTVCDRANLFLIARG